MNFGVHVSFLISGFFFSGYTRRSRIAGFEVDTSHVFLWGGARDGGPRAGVGREVGLPFCSMAVTLLLGRGSDPKLLEKKPWASGLSCSPPFNCVFSSLAASGPLPQSRRCWSKWGPCRARSGLHHGWRRFHFFLSGPALVLNSNTSWDRLHLGIQMRRLKSHSVWRELVVFSNLWRDFKGGTGWGYFETFAIISRSFTAPMLVWFVNWQRVGCRQSSELSSLHCLCSTCNCFLHSIHMQHPLEAPFFLHSWSLPLASTTQPWCAATRQGRWGWHGFSGHE